MAPLRSASRRVSPLVLPTLLCFVIIMQMLGTPASLWQPDGDFDLVETSLLEGLSLVPHEMTWPPLVRVFGPPDCFDLRSSLLLGESLFRPPSPYHPAMSLAS